ncbi:Protocadherin alpha 4 unspliced [Phytophthora cinnamomi]|uniref:Protocadherin alpha 4 unspliced n=1 Tax=Phytophthora cinnamomi TaxID=4785 RepID=UPI00355A4CA1|nr:Protocadherin alpha 4 unspliced [Phytophthora cinnamomi]
MSVSSSWADGVAGYANAAESRVLYQAASWSLLDEGTQSGKFESYWARFQSVNPTIKSSVRLSVCAMVAEWNSSWSDTKSALVAVNLEDRMATKCGENDTIAVAFTSSVSKTAASYLKGEIAVNDVVAALKMHDVDSSMVPNATDRMFVRLANGLCPRDESANGLNSLAVAGIPVASLFRGTVCKPSGGFGPSQITSEGSASSNESDWKDDLKFIIPVGVFIFLLGCAGLIYLYRQQKKLSAQQTPKEVEKDEASSLPYVLTMHSVV